MQKIVLVLALAGALALAGCASNNSTNNNGNNSTTTSSTPASSTSASSTPVSSSPVISTPMTPNGTDNMTHAQCPFSPVSGAASSQLMVGVKEPAANTTEGSAEHCFSFVGLHNVTAGLVNITLVNNGTMPHVLVVQRLTGNHTMMDFVSAMMSAPEGSAQPSWVQDWGGPSLLGPGRSSTVWQDMPEGTYVVYCWFGGHLMMGMMAEIHAVNGTSTLTTPTADVHLDLVDFAFHFRENLTAGHHVIAIHDNGTQSHEAPFVQLMGNTTIMQFADAIEDPNATGPPPGMPWAGINAISAGQTVYVDATFVPGNYGLICFVTDPATGMPHALKGMQLDFTVS